MIYINARFLTQQITGVQRFAIELSKQLILLLGRDKVMFLSPHNIIHRDLAAQFNVQIIGKRTGYYWEQIELPRFLNKKGCPKLLNFCSIAPLFYSNNFITLHDITWIRYPETFSLTFRTVYNILIPLLCNKAKHIFTVSNFSLKEISEYFKVPSDKISVVYNAVSSNFEKQDDEILKKENYFITVSSLKQNKNFFTTLEAFLELQKLNDEAYLYIVGDLKSKSFKDLDVTKYEENPHIKFLGRISDEDLIKYYSNAVAFIFPSFYEGFGIPVLEAQACGCPVISSNSSSLPEILNDSALICNPNIIKDFTQAMHNILKDSTMRENLSKLGFDNVKRFSWMNSAKQILNKMQ